jgi:formate dehydrogenase subunit delta
MQSVDKLVLMANQIVRNLVIQGDDKAVELAADHMRKFWDPRMRNSIQRHLQSGGKGLTPLAIRAVEQLDRLEPVAS